MAKLFFLFSGEHPTLPCSELKAILKAEGHKYRVLVTLPRLLQVEADVTSVKSVVRRAAMTRICNLELFSCDAVATKIFNEADLFPFENFVAKNESFVVRVRRIGESVPALVTEELERKLGEKILTRVKEARVHLTNPDKTFFGILTVKKFIFGLRLAEISPKPFMERRPRKRPFFHPSAMPPKLARSMVNLAQPKTGELVLDPFCGTASTLIEAGLIGCRVIGFDVQRRMVEGSLRNLLHYGVKPEAVGVADARNLPITRVDCVVTDPPYGRSASTLGRDIKEVVLDFLEAVKDIIPRGRCVCIALPKPLEIGKMSRQLGFKLMSSHFVYVHRSLTREIAVLERA